MVGGLCHALERKPEHAIVVGGGYIGLEMAEAMVKRGIAVALVDRARSRMATLDPDMGALVADAIRGVGVDLRTSESITGFETGAGGRVAVVTKHGNAAPPTSLCSASACARTSRWPRRRCSARSERGDRRRSAAAHTGRGGWAGGDC